MFWTFRNDSNLKYVMPWREHLSEVFGFSFLKSDYSIQNFQYPGSWATSILNSCAPQKKKKKWICFHLKQVLLLSNLPKQAHTLTYAHVHSYLCTHTYVNGHMCTYLNAHIYTCMYRHKCTHEHPNIHPGIHTHIWKQQWKDWLVYPFGKHSEKGGEKAVVGGKAHELQEKSLLSLFPCSLIIVMLLWRQFCPSKWLSPLTVVILSDAGYIGWGRHVTLEA
jgi:hypothetical protein